MNKRMRKWNQRHTLAVPGFTEGEYHYLRLSPFGAIGLVSHNTEVQAMLALGAKCGCYRYFATPHGHPVHLNMLEDLDRIARARKVTWQQSRAARTPADTAVRAAELHARLLYIMTEQLSDASVSEDALRLLRKLPQDQLLLAWRTWRESRMRPALHKRDWVIQLTTNLAASAGTYTSVRVLIGHFYVARDGQRRFKSALQHRRRRRNYR